MLSIATTVDDIRTEKNASLIADCIRESGISLLKAGERFGINSETVRSWAKTDRAFSDSCNRARAEWLYDRGRQLAETDPTTGLLAHPREVAWLMAKHAPEEYGDVVRHEVSGQIDHFTISASELLELQARRKAALENQS